MAGAKDFSYLTLDLPYDNNMQRSPTVEITPSTGFGSDQGANTDQSNENPNGEGIVLKAGQELIDVWLGTWMKSRNFQPKTQGFMIDGRTGYIECMRIFVGKGGIEGGSINIPSQEDLLSWHVDNLGNMWSGANVDQWNTDPTRNNAFAKAVIQNDGRARFYDIVIDSGVFIGAMFLTATDGIHAPGPAVVRVEIGGDTPGTSNDATFYEDTLGSVGGIISGDVASLKFRRLGYPTQEFVIQKRVGAYSSVANNADNIAEFFYTNPHQGTARNQILLGFNGQGYSETPVILNTQKIHAAAEYGVRVTANYAGIKLVNRSDDFYNMIDANNGRVYLSATQDGANGFNPVTETGGAAVVMRIQVPFVTLGVMAWADINGFWFYDNAQKIRPYTNNYNDLGDNTHKFNNIYLNQLHFDTTHYLWLDPGPPYTLNLQAGNFHVNGDIGCMILDAATAIRCVGNLFTPQTITYKDGAGVNQTRTFLMV